MTRASELLESIKEINEGWIQDLVAYDKVKVEEVEGNYVVTVPVKTASTQDANRLFANLKGMGYDAKLTTDNLGVILTIPKADAAKAKEELGIEL